MGFKAAWGADKCQIGVSCGGENSCALLCLADCVDIQVEFIIAWWLQNGMRMCPLGMYVLQ